jgi:hypothetical protein
MTGLFSVLVGESILETVERERNQNLPNTNEDDFCLHIGHRDPLSGCHWFLCYEELEENGATRISICHFIDRMFGQLECHTTS